MGSAISVSDFPELLRRTKSRLLQMHFESGVGHIGGNLSALDILMCLYHGVLEQNDCFVLSKGHAAGALYVTLWSQGVLTDDQLRQFHKDNTLLSGHPPFRGIPEIPFATGSLGHGLGLASGVAFGKKLRSLCGHVFCLTSDGEWNEGSSWESLIFIHQHKLDNLTLIVDANGLQGFGTTKEVADIDPISQKFSDFGLCVEEVDGHHPESLLQVLGKRRPGPRAVIARTVKGHGVSFMENRMEWHYLPMNKDQYYQAVREIT